MKRGAWGVIAVVIALAGLGIFSVQRLEGSAPILVTDEKVVLGPKGWNLIIDLEDHDSGPRSLQVRLLDQSGSRSLAEKSFPGGSLAGGDSEASRQHFELHLDPADLATAVCSTCHPTSDMEASHDGLYGFASDDPSCIGCHPDGVK